MKIPHRVPQHERRNLTSYRLGQPNRFNNYTGVSTVAEGITNNENNTKRPDTILKSEAKNETCCKINHPNNSTNNTDVDSVAQNTKPTKVAQFISELSNNKYDSNNTGNRKCKKITKEGSISLSATMLVLLNIAAIFDGGIPLLIDTLVMTIIKRQTGNKRIDYGKQRVWGAVG